METFSGRKTPAFTVCFRSGPRSNSVLGLSWALGASAFRVLLEPLVSQAPVGVQPRHVYAWALPGCWEVRLLEQLSGKRQSGTAESRDPLFLPPHLQVFLPSLSAEALELTERK